MEAYPDGEDVKDLRLNDEREHVVVVLDTGT